jgi:outer membrane cobalamin receptor
MNINEIATQAVTGNKTAQVIWSSLSTREIIQAMIIEAEQAELHQGS